MERIRENGKSALLSLIADRVGNAVNTKVDHQSMNIVPDTVIEAPMVRKMNHDHQSVNVVSDTEIAPSMVKNVSIASVSELMGASCLVEVIEVQSYCCNEEWKSMDLSRFLLLRELDVGDDCFENVNEVKLIGLHALEKVVVGKNSFTKHKNDHGDNSTRRFYLKDCEQVKEVKMGRFSFSDFSVCEIANVPSLEVIEMGEAEKMSYNFYNASLELKSVGDGVN